MSTTECYKNWVNITHIIPDAWCVKVTHFRLKNEYFKLLWGDFGKKYHYWLDIIMFCLFNKFYLKKGIFQEIYLCSPGHGRFLNLFAVNPINESWWKRKIGIRCSQLFQIMNYLPITTNFKHFFFFLFSDGLLGLLFAFNCNQLPNFEEICRHDQFNSTHFLTSSNNWKKKWLKFNSVAWAE